jgi:two-component system sensor histidine kinase CpxA
MRRLYWKIFISFWLATILVILTVAWFTSHLAQSASMPMREYAFMDSYANAAVTTYESGGRPTLNQWLQKTNISQKMKLFFIDSQGNVLNTPPPPPSAVLKIATKIRKHQLAPGIVKTEELIVSHEVYDHQHLPYRLVALSVIPLSHFLAIHWAGLTLRILSAVFISGLICYALAYFLTHPIRVLQKAARDIGQGKLNTRVIIPKGHKNDDIDMLGQEFNKMASKIEALVISKERLLQDISHELRSPLARLHIATALLKKAAPDQVHALNRIDVECEKLNDLIGEIIHFTRLDSAQINPSLERIHLPSLIQDIMNDANFEFGAHQERVIAKKLESVIIRGDKRLLHRAIENIIRNALHYSPQDKKVLISLYHKAQQLILDIKDEGPGLSENELQKIFNPFYRVDSARDKKTGGFGLGLAIAREAIRLHKGQILAKNRPHGGLLVRIVFMIE